MSACSLRAKKTTILSLQVQLKAVLQRIERSKHRQYCKLEISSMERSICPIDVLYFAVTGSFFNI